MNPLDPRGAAVYADLHQVSMAAACWDHGVTQPATFEISLAALPPNCGFMVSAGLDPVIQYLVDFQFSKEQLQFFRNLYWYHPVRREFWDELAQLRFTGDLWAAPEGTPVFPGEPFLRITAPIMQGLLVESYVLSTLSFCSGVATRAARAVEAAGGKNVIDHGYAHNSSAGAGVLAARAAHIAGSAGTTNPSAGIECGVPLHNAQGAAFSLAFPSGRDAMRAWAATFHETAMLALDPHDPVAGARMVADLGLRVRAVLIATSGVSAGGNTASALAATTREVRGILDEAALEGIKIAVVGPLDEFAIAALTAAGAAIDAFHIEGQLSDPGVALRPTLSSNLVEMTGKDGLPVIRTSLPHVPGQAARASLSGVRQVYRSFGIDGRARRDVVALAGAKPAGAAVLQNWIEAGKVSVSRPGLETIREYTTKALGMLSPEIKRLESPAGYPVELPPTATMPSAEPAG